MSHDLCVFAATIGGFVVGWAAACGVIVSKKK